MLYVALSRARTAEGLRIIAPREDLLVKRCNADIQIVSFYNRLEKEIGKVKLKRTGSAAGHNGIESCIQSLGTKVIPRQ